MRPQRRLRVRRQHVLGVLAAAWLCGATDTMALDPSRRLNQYVHQQWHAAEGLPQETVQALAVSTDGYLWVGTQDGLARYDGSRFVLFHPRTHSDLPHRLVWSLAPDRDGRMWVGTVGGLVLYDAGRFERIGGDLPLATGVVRRLVVSRDGATLWAGTAAGLFRVDTRPPHRVTPVAGISTAVHDVVESAPDRVVVSTTTGFYTVAGTEATRHPQPAGIDTIRRQMLLVDRRGDLWVSSERGTWRYRRGTFEPVPLPRSVVGEWVSGLFEDRDGYVWLGGDNGVVRATAGEQVSLEVGLPEVRRPITMVEDAQGGLWIGSWGHGLHRLRTGRATVIGAPEGLAGDYVLGILETRDRAVWAGTFEGLTRMRDGVVRTWTARDGLPGTAVRALHESPDGTLWIGTSAGLCRLRGERVQCDVRGTDNLTIFSLSGDGGNGVWVGAWSGLFHVVGSATTGPPLTRRDGLPADFTWMVHRARDGALWVGGEGHGLSRIVAGRVEHFAPPVVPAEFAVTAYEEDDGTLWFGTSGAGLLRYRDGRFAHVSGAPWFPDDVVYSIVPDRADGLWMSSNRGIFRVARRALHAAADGRPSQLTPDVVGVVEGLRSAECNGTIGTPAFLAHDGRLWVATTSGIAVVNPAETSRPRRVPVVIEAVMADRQPVPLASTVVIPAGRTEIDIQFAVLSFASGNGDVVRYRLQGVDRDWRIAAGERVGRYTNIAPGPYVFEVQSVGHQGSAPAGSDTIMLMVRPHVYQTWWFQSLVVLGAAGSVTAGVFLRLRQARARERELQRSVEEALRHVKVLQGVLPVCAWCRKVRTDSGAWQQLEGYVAAHTDAEFTHGICPSCAGEIDQRR